MDPLTFQDLSAQDAGLINGIATSAFGPSANRTEEIRRYLRLTPNRWLLASLHGEPAGVLGLTDYGTFGFLGMMTVREELQRRGIGEALLTRMLRWADARGMSLLRLDATDVGYPLYARSGFEVVDEAALYACEKPFSGYRATEGLRRLRSSDIPALVALDVAVFGGDRAQLFQALLTDFPGRAYATHDASDQMTGFLFAQKRRLGPWVSRTPDDAEVLLCNALSLDFEEPPVVVTPRANAEAVELIHRYGFQLKRGGRHMQRGSTVVPGQRTAIFGQTSFAIG